MTLIRHRCLGFFQLGFTDPHGPSSSRGPDEAGRRGAAPARDSSLQGLAGSSVADRFRAWQGASGRRYVFSVFAVDPWDGLLDRLPSGGDAVVIAVRRGEGRMRTPLWIGQTAGDPEAFLLGDRVRLLAGTTCELHLHVLGSDADERDAIVRDLRGSV